MAREKKSPAPDGSPGGGADASSPSFEQAIERLQTIVEELEGGSLSLEESITRYEEGVKLARRLTQTLDQAEKRIERLAENEAGETTTEPMDLESGPTDEASGGGRPGRATAGDEREGELPF